MANRLSGVHCTGAGLYAVPMAREHPARYQQVAGDLRSRIASGEFPPGSRLPTKAELMSHYGIALSTLNGAIRILIGESLVESVQGLGMFARQPPETSPSEFDVLMKQVDEIRGQVKALTERMDAAEQAFGLTPTEVPDPERQPADQASGLSQTELTGEQAELIRNLQDEMERLRAQVINLYHSVGQEYPYAETRATPGRKAV